MGANMRTAIAGRTTAGRTTQRLGILATAVACLFFIAGEDVSVAGIQGSGFYATSYGYISEFGSIFVNGVEYDISAASIVINGQPATESQLRLGQVVTVKGRVNAEGTAGEATDVSVTSTVRGPLANVDLENGTLMVLGQRIRLLPDTFLDPQLHLGGILGLLPGIKVTVSGFPNAAGEIVATRIDLASGGGASRFTGVVQSLNTNAQTFRVNEELVNYSDATLVGTLAEGRTVSVAGTVPFGQGVLHATSVEVISGVGGAVDEVGHVEGLITVFNSATEFALGAQKVVTDDDTVFILEGKTLGPDLGVVVRGTYDSAGVLLARQVKVTSLGLLGVLGSAEKIPAGAQLAQAMK